MTNFEQIFLLSRPIPKHIVVDNQEKHSGVIDITDAMTKTHNDIQMQMQYRELDRQSRELEKELAAVKALRMELEKYRMDFSISVADEATKKIQEVLNGIDKMIK